MTPFASQKPAVGLIGGKLRPCPARPNCVSSEALKSPARVNPFAFTGSPEAAWSKLKRAVAAIGGDIQSAGVDYLWATFTSRWMGFVDDMEFRLDCHRGIIHVRSAARTGWWDMGVNRRRIERLRREMAGP